MGWIDYKKAFDMVPKSWILKFLDIFKIADNIKIFLKNSMKNWETVLSAGGESLEKVRIKRGIFQGDSLPPLLFVISLIPMSFILQPYQLRSPRSKLKVKAGYEVRKAGPTINHLLYMDDLKLFGKTEKQLDTLMNTVRIFRDDIRM